MLPASPFASFWMAGFESATHRNRGGVRLDLIAATQHDQQVVADYALVAARNMRTVREGVRWPLIEREGRFDFASLSPVVDAAQAQGIQVIWTLCHYGWPDDLDVFSPAFIDRFARYCTQVARFLADHTDQAPCYTPINEISFLAWAAGEVGYIYPFGTGRGGDLKRQLVRAAIAGSEALWAVDPRARLVHVDPLIHVVPPRGHPELAEAARRQRASQFEAWDLLTGRQEPELGGNPGFVDIMGLNLYHANQWEYPDVRLRWEDVPRDDRWVPFHQLFAEVAARYQRPLILGETSHFGTGRARWLREVTDEVEQARAHGVALEGICLYPILDRPDWDDPAHWHHSGLWDLVPDADGHLQRVLDPDYAAELRRCQARLGPRPSAAISGEGLASAP